METTFHNVEISIIADSPQKAYDKLCQLLNSKDVEFTTNTFTAEKCQEESTVKLFS